MTKLEITKAILQESENYLEKGEYEKAEQWLLFHKFVTELKPKGLSIEQRKEKFYIKLSTRVEEYGKPLVREFYDYWAEHGDSDKKMRFEKETSFDITKRLQRWKRKQKDNPNETFKPNTETHVK